MTIKDLKEMYEERHIILTFDVKGGNDVLDETVEKMYVTKISDDRFKVVAYSGNTKMKMIVRRK